MSPDGEAADELGASGWKRGMQAVFSLDGDALDRAFALLLLLFFAGLLASTPRYSPDSRLFPIVIGVPTLVLLVALVLAQTSDRFAALFSGFASSDLFDLEDRFTERMGENPGDREPLWIRRQRLLAMALWMGLMFGLVLLIGFIPATVVFLLVFYRVYAGVSWPRATGYTVTFTVAVVIVFDFIMGTTLYEGIFGIAMPF